MPRPEPAQPDDLLDPPGQQQIIDHVEHQQRLHGIIREALARLGEAEVAEALGMAEEGAVVRSSRLHSRGWLRQRVIGSTPNASRLRSAAVRGTGPAPAEQQHQQRRRRRRLPRAATRRRAGSSSRRRCRSSPIRLLRDEQGQEAHPHHRRVDLRRRRPRNQREQRRPEIHEADALQRAVEHRPDPQHRAADPKGRSPRRAPGWPLPR